MINLAHKVSEKETTEIYF